MSYFLYIATCRNKNAFQHYRLATSPPIFLCMRMGGSTKNCCTLVALYPSNVLTHKHSSCVQCLVEMKIICKEKETHNKTLALSLALNITDLGDSFKSSLTTPATPISLSTAAQDAFYAAPYFPEPATSTLQKLHSYLNQ